MKKLNYLLHSVTVIDFVLVAKLMLRYRMLTVVGILLLLGLIPYVHLAQPLVFQKEVYFKVVRDESVQRESKVLADLTAPRNSMNETVALVSSYEFLGKLASKLAAEKNFSSLNFDHPTMGIGNRVRELERCGDANCRMERLRGLLPSLFSLTADAATERFTLKITSRSKQTTLQILRAFEVVINDQRIAIATEQTDKQLAQLRELAAKSRRDLEGKGGFDKLASSEFLEALITQQKSKILSISNRLSQGDSQAYSQWVRLKETDLTSQTSIEGSQKLIYESYVKVNKRVDELRQDIAALASISPTSRTETDSLILAKLQRELVVNEAELAKMGKVSRNLNLDDSFINIQKGNKSAMEFDYRVSGAKVRKFRVQYEQAKAELDELYSRKGALENELIALKPDLEYLKLIESKLVALRFKQSSISSDVHFDPYGPEVQSFKRNSLGWIALFSFAFVMFVLFISYIIFYLFDDRIFDELEVERCLGELPIVGHAPQFE